jgi:hypothetical protein
MPRIDRPDPRLPSGDDMFGQPFGPLHYEPASGPLFVRGAEANDVAQGKIGDCFFLAALAALAKVRPADVQRAVHDNANGTYTVTFKEKARGGVVRDVTVTVDGDLPRTPDGKVAFGRGLDVTSAGKAELWPAIYEKAYATYQRGGYKAIDQGGYADQALFTLTGRAAKDYTITDVRADALWKKLETATRDGKPVVTCTFADDVHDRLVRGRADKDRLIGDHAYTVTGVSERGGVKYVELWSTLAPKKGDRALTVKFDDYRKLFEDVIIGG